MKIDDLTIGEARELARLFGCSTPGTNHNIPVGQAVFIRTVTHYYTGKVEAISDTDLVLSSAAWIPDSGRWSDMLATGQVGQCEPYPDNIKPIITRSCITDVCAWPHPLPRVRK